MNDLVAFLKARLDEDEEVAQLATAGPWEWRTFHGVDELVHPVTVGGWPAHPMNVLKSSHEGWPPNGSDKDHIARHDPARVLAEVEAKRAILALHGTNTQEPYAAKVPGGIFYPPDPYYCGCQAEDGLIYGHEPCDTKRLLAVPYADHPDFDPSWGI